MLKEIHIKNFKSIVDDKIELGRVNVFIGENGCGKSNILEAVAFAGTTISSVERINTETLQGKGVRIAMPSLMVNAFKNVKTKDEILVKINNDLVTNFKYIKDYGSYSEYQENVIGHGVVLDKVEPYNEISTFPRKLQVSYKLSPNQIQEIKVKRKLEEFLIYCLNTPALRGMTTQSHKEPVGIYGEGLDVLIANFDNEERAKLAEFNYMIDWLDAFLVDTQDAMKLKGYKMNRSKSTLYFSDKYMTKKNNVFSSENANEGILHVLFYLGVMISKRTPKFFAIDNIEACLNPHLCRHLMVEICKLARDTDKQLMITTHNPAILDGLNLFDDDVRLFEVKRNDKGHTVTRRIKIKPETDLEKYKLSELWTRGYLGAIAQNF